jgi:DNA-binding HxlR family transcriptional regulator
MKGYGQFCPVAKAAEIVAERWTPLILRELCYGPRRFNDVRRTMPLISRTLLAKRLRELERDEVLTSTPRPDGRGHIYRLTEAGEALRPLVAAMSDWGQRWAQGRISDDDLDPALLVWGMRRQMERASLPERRFVVQLEFFGIPPGRHRNARYWWLLFQKPEVEVCLKDPGFPVDVTITADLGTFTRVWLGQLGLGEARRMGRIALRGEPADLRLACALLALPEQPALKRLQFDHDDFYAAAS